MTSAASIKTASFLSRWLLVGLLAIGSTLSFGQDVLEDEAFNPEQMTVAELSEEVARQLESLRRFEAYPLPESFERRRTFEVRRDEKTIKVLKSIISLAQNVLDLPEDAPERAKLRQLMSMREGQIERAIGERFESLTERLNASLDRQRELSGVQLLSEEAFADLIDKYRLSYLGLSTEQALLLERLDIGDETLREKVLKTLNLYGEELVGVIHIHHHALQLLAARQDAAGTDAELVQSARFEAERLELAIARLNSVVTMLERLDGDTLAMRRVLIEKAAAWPCP